MTKKIENFYRKEISYNSEQIAFQATEWLEMNEEIEIETEDEPIIDHRYTIKIFGVTEEGYSVCCNVKEFTPFFYIKVPGNWTKTHVKKFIDDLFAAQTYRYARPYADLMKFRKNILDDKCILQIKKDFYGFNNSQDFKFLRLTFNNSDVLKKVVYKIRHHNDKENQTKIKNINFDIKIYESNLDSILRFIHIKDLQPTGWIQAKKIQFPLIPSSKCQIECDVYYNNIFPLEKVNNSPILQASFDIETYSYDDYFPSPEHPENHVFQIATAFKKFNDSDFMIKHIICLKACSPIEDKDIILECYNTEKEVLLAWVRLIQKMDPDVLYSYNGDQFDFNYLVKRARLLKIEDQFYNISRMKNIINPPCKLVEKSFSSSAYGDNEYKRLIIPGRINFDILIYIRREYKEDSYTLNYISEKYVGENKNPVTPQMMFDAFREQDADKLNTVALYCVKDTLLPQKISDTLHILQNQISMSNVTFIPIKYLIEQGQQIKAFSQILKKTRKLGYLVPVLSFYGDDKDDDENFVGATVLEPIKGAHFEPITVCDFASLYPSIIRAHNLCYSTIVLDEKYLGIENVEYKTFEWEDVDKKTGHLVPYKFTYVQNTQGILPIILKELAESRNHYKKLMKNAKDKFEKEIYNKCQLAVKVSMNSVYGFLAAYKLPCKPIAATTTYVGRTMIEATKNFMEKNYAASVAVYGDSVSADTPIIIKENISGFIEIIKISDICDERDWVPYENFKTEDTIISNRREKQKYTLCHYSVWSDNGWVELRKVIRHKCNKKMYRITTNSGSVDVTEDHSLLTDTIEKIKPKDTIVGTTLLHVSKLPSSEFTYELYSIPIWSELEHVKLLGFILNYGYYLYDIDNDTFFLQIRHSSKFYLQRIVNLIKKYESKNLYPQSYVIEHYDDSVFCISIYAYNSDKNNLVNKFKSKFLDDDNSKKVPQIFFNSSLEVRKAFIEGYLLFNDLQVFDYNNESKLELQGIIFLAESVGINLDFINLKSVIKINENENDYKVHELTRNSIINIQELGRTEEYVYDIETNIGRFHAGTGKIVVANTDSVFIKFKTETTDFYIREKERIYSQVVITEKDKLYLHSLKTKCIQESIELGKKAATNATKSLFKEPINLEYEKVYMPLLMLSKKRYIGHLYSDNPEKIDKFDNKGVILARRDNFNLLKTSYKHIVDIYMEKGKNGNNEVIRYIENIMDSIKNNRIDLNELIVSKSLKKDYKNQNLPHVALARKITERDPNNSPRPNDRIPYILVDSGIPKATPQYTRVEDPEYAKKHNLSLDTEHYVSSLSNPLCQIMELFMDNPEKIFKDYIKAYKTARKALLCPPKTKDKLKQPTIKSMITKKTKKTSLK